MKNKFLLPAILLSGLINVNSYAQDTSTVKLNEVTVTSFRVNRKIAQMPASLSVAGSFDYKKNSSFTVANVLNNEPGIAMGGDGVWATNINVRGLSEERLVTLIDGCRVETATDLTASLSMIDVNDIDRVEIIKGAQSSLYGTGAMGGIINVITKSGWFASKPYISGELISGYASANKYFSTYGGVNAGSEKWYLRVSGSYGNADDMRTPEGTLDNSQFKTNNVSAKFGFKPFKNHTFRAQYQRNWSDNVGIPGGSAFPSKATATYTDIGRVLFDASYEIENITDKFKSLKLSYFHQYILRDVTVNPHAVTNVKLPNGNTQRTTPNYFTPHATHTTNGAQLQGVWNFSDNNTFIAGVDVWSRKMSSTRTKYITIEVLKPDATVLKTNNVIRYETPLPSSTFTSTGAFIQDEAHFLDNRLTLTVGGRIDGVFVSNDECYDVDSLKMNGNLQKPVQRFTFKSDNTSSISWSANVGALYKLGKRVDAVINLARSYRAPSLEERFKYIDLSSYVRLGNPDLDPESGYSADLGIRFWGEKFNMQASVYVNSIKNMITEQHGEFIYSLLGDEATKDTIPALVNANVSKALLYGFDFKAQYAIFSNVDLKLAASYVRGKETENDTDLPLIPPFSGRFGISYTYPSLLTAEISVTAAAKQKKIANGEIPTDGYARLDFSINSKRFNLWNACGLQLFAGVENITDKAYTNHLSTNRGSVSVEPGRNVYAKLSLSF